MRFVRPVSSRLAFRVQGSGCRVQDSGFRVQGPGCVVAQERERGVGDEGVVRRVWGLGFQAQGSGCKE